MAKIAVFSCLCLMICMGRIAESEARVGAERRPSWFPRPYHPLPRAVLPSMPPEYTENKLRKCFGGVRVESRCMHQIYASFWNEAVDMEPDCCKVVEGFSEECSDTVFARFQNPFFKLLLKEHCCNKNKPPPPCKCSTISTTRSPHPNI